MQDVHTISEANVKVRTGTDKWKDLGTFDKEQKLLMYQNMTIFSRFDLNGRGKSASIYEIYTNEDENKIQMISESM